MNELLSKKINRSLSYRLTSRIAQQALALFFSIYLARILSPSEFGVIAIINLVIHYANGITNLGFGNALVQRDIIDSDHIDSVFTVDLILSILMAVSTYVLSDYIALFFEIAEISEALKWMALYYVITTFRHVPEALLRRDLEFKYLSIASLVEMFANYSLTIILALNGFSYWSILISTLIVSSLYSVAIMFKLGRVPRIKYCRLKMQDIYSFGFWNFFRGQFELLVAKVDYFVIGKFLGPYFLGIYEKSFELTDRGAKGFSLPISSVFFSAFSREKNNLLKVKDLFLQSINLVSLVVFPILFGLFSVSSNFVYSCLGSEWTMAIIPIKVLSLSLLFKVVSSMISSVNVSVGKYRANAIIAICASIVFAIMCFVVVEHGVNYICWLFFFYSIVNCFMLFQVTRKCIFVSYVDFFRNLIFPLIFSLIMVFIVKIFNNYYVYDVSSFASFLFLVFVGAFVYVSLCLILLRSGKLRFSVVE